MLAVLLACCTAVPAISQDPRFGEVIEVSLVNVDVIVTDRAGNHVRGLTADDFELYENGKLQPVTNFAEYRGSGATRTVVAAAQGTPSAPAAAEAAPPQKRNILVFVDKLQVHGRERRQLFDGVKQFLRRSVRPGDAVGIASWVSGPRSAQELTDDMKQLDAALDKLAAERGKVQKSEWDYIELEKTQLEWYYAQGASIGSGGSAGVLASQYDAAARVVLDVRQKARSITSLMQTMAGAEGQKILVLLSHRFAPNSGAEYTGIGNDMAITADAQIGEMVNVAKANGIRVYPLYATLGDLDVGETASLQGPPALNAATQRSSLRNIETSSLMNIANETGGVAGTGLGDIEKVFTSISEDLESYYSLAYRATEPNRGQPKRLTVKVKNGAYRVRTRRDVVDRTSETLLRQRIIASLLQPPRVEGFPVNVFLRKARTESGLLHLPLQIKVPVSALTLLPDGAAKHSGGFSVYIAWAGELGTSSDITKRSYPVAVEAAQLAASKSQVITYDVEFAATRAVDRVVVAVVDDVTQEVGLVRFDIPRAGRK
ncbi:MAG TPA: VWA domain-containing protein [Thermoanaerobaculia bacterium]|jgi:VWFA-related protein